MYCSYHWKLFKSIHTSGSGTAKEKKKNMIRLLQMKNQMSLKGRGQGVDLGTSTLSLIRSIFFSYFGLAFPYEPLNLFPFFVFLSPRPHSTGTPAADGGGGGGGDDNDESDDMAIRCSVDITILLAIAPYHCIIAILLFGSLNPRARDSQAQREKAGTLLSMFGAFYYVSDLPLEIILLLRQVVYPSQECNEHP
ncbi:unnamed protein product [Ilex paraguariensis]|uniref:Uncharacterized protein n=1 Tax=Ilex paraguariensis TaxID=185542 RepID=A0ABC8SXW2_9AQUA